MGSFNWRDEETGWDVPEKDRLDKPEEPPAKTNRRFWLAGLFGVVLGLAILSWLGWQRVQEVEEQLEEQVLESWSLIVQSAHSHDVELLINQLSGRDPDWVLLQQQLLTADHFLGRGTLLPDFEIVNTVPEDLEDITIEFAPDQFEATLSRPVTYVDGWGNPITLTQSGLFRQGVDRWLYAPPPPAEVSPETLQVRLDRLTYEVPQEDAEMASLIFEVFDQVLDKMCNDGFTYACVNVQIDSFFVVFEPELTQAHIQISQLSGRLPNFSSSIEVNLPAPSLLGTPKTEIDERRMAQAYAGLIFEPYLILAITAEGERLDPFLIGMTQYSLYQADGLPPLQVADYQRLNESFDRVESAFKQNRVLGSNFPDVRQFMDFPVRTTFWALIEFKLLQGDVSADDLLTAYHVAETQPIFPPELITADDWDDFQRFVAFRASLSPNNQESGANK